MPLRIVLTFSRCYCNGYSSHMNLLACRAKQAVTTNVDLPVHEESSARDSAVKITERFANSKRLLIIVGKSTFLPPS